MRTVQERFEAKFEKGGRSDCWEWTAGKNWDGYGTFKIAGRTQKAHRVAYQLYVGEIIDGLHTLHRCDNPSCVNPSHLLLGTNADNVRDCVDKGRGASGEKHGKAKLTTEQVETIRVMWSEGVRGVDLAIEFGVAHQTISDIVCRRNWAKT